MGVIQVSSKVAVSPSMQDYLKAILNLSELNGQVRVTDIAEHLGVAKPSVHQAATQLAKAGLVVHEKYGPLELTEKGLETAKSVRDKHSMLVKFFVEVLGVDSETAHQDACLIEHAISPVTMENLIKHFKEYTR